MTSGTYITAEQNTQNFLRALCQYYKRVPSLAALAAMYGLTVNDREEETAVEESRFFRLTGSVEGTYMEANSDVIEQYCFLQQSYNCLLEIVPDLVIDTERLRAQGVRVGPDVVACKVYHRSFTTHRDTVWLCPRTRLQAVNVLPFEEGEPSLYLVNANGELVRAVNRGVIRDAQGDLQFAVANTESQTLNIDNISYSLSSRRTEDKELFGPLKTQNPHVFTPSYYVQAGLSGLKALYESTKNSNRSTLTEVYMLWYNMVTKAYAHVLKGQVGTLVGDTSLAIAPRAAAKRNTRVFIPVGPSIFVPAIFQPTRLRVSSHIGYSIPAEVQQRLRKKTYVPLQLWMNTEKLSEALLVATRFGKPAPSDSLNSVKFLPQYHGSCMGDIQGTDVLLSQAEVHTGRIIEAVISLVARIEDAYSRINTASPGTLEPLGLPHLHKLRLEVEKEENRDAGTRILT